MRDARGEVTQKWESLGCVRPYVIGYSRAVKCDDFEIDRFCLLRSMLHAPNRGRGHIASVFHTDLLLIRFASPAAVCSQFVNEVP